MRHVRIIFFSLHVTALAKPEHLQKWRQLTKEESAKYFIPGEQSSQNYLLIKNINTFFYFRGRYSSVVVLLVTCLLSPPVRDNFPPLPHIAQMPHKLGESGHCIHTKTYKFIPKCTLHCFLYPLTWIIVAHAQLFCSTTRRRLPAW